MSTAAPVPSYDGVVLAGGRARRMGGTDKTALVVQGHRLLDIALDALGAAGRRVVVGGRGPLVGADRVTEDPPGGGPVAALAAGLGAVRAPVCVVLAADLPFVTTAHVQALFDELLGGAACLAVDAEGRDQPLLAAYATEALRAALPEEPHGASMRALLSRLREQGAVRRIALGGDPAPWFDCDTPEDLERARGARQP